MVSLETKNSYNYLLDIDKIIHVYKKIITNTKHRGKILDFNVFYTTNMISIYDSLTKKEYHHDRYNIFLINEPKARIIMSEKIRDKIVNHLVSDYILLPLIEPLLIEENVATRKEKGTKMAIYYMKRFLIDMHKKYKQFYILKCDISKYFYNIDHEVLLKELEKIVLDKDIFKLINNIVNSTNESYVNNCIDNINLKNNLTLPNYNYGKGLPIGNQTSQILAIYYLNDLDHYIKKELGIKHYIRYMDDFILMHQDKEYLKMCQRKIEKFLIKKKLKLNKKTNIYNINNGIPFLGFKYFFKKNKLIMIILSNTKRRIKKRIRKGETTIMNYNGYLCFGNTNNFIYVHNKRI